MSSRIDELALESAERTEAEEAYRTLKERIALLELRPGTTMREADLQEELGVRRTPLREALRRLADDGMVQIYPRHGIVVASLGFADIRRIYEARIVIERGTAALCAQRRTAAELAELQAYADEIREARRLNDRERYNRAHRRFHRLIARCARNPMLERYVDHALTLNTWLWSAFVDAHEDDQADMSDHEELMTALTAGNPALAEESMRVHITSSKEAMLAGL